MIVLAVETAADVGSAAVWSPEGAHSIPLTERRRHGTSIGPACDAAMRGRGVSARDLTAVAVGLGPGSYTGARIAVAFAKTMAFTLDLPLVGLSGFMAAAADSGAAPGTEVVVLAPGHKTRVYGAAYRVGAAGEIPEELSPPALWDESELRTAYADAVVVGGADASPDVSAATLARLAVRWLEAGRDPSDVRTLEPLYLQPSAPERKRG